uniref:Subtilisin-like protease SDD1 n=1 Tax=Triticum urartu TaxID=4572 RepID=A0A8R7TQT9_TRIUA
MASSSPHGICADYPEVISVQPSRTHRTTTTQSWDFLGLNYQKPSAGSGLLDGSKYGDDVIIGVVDTGIWPESRSFSDEGYGPIPSRWKGKCQVGAARSSALASTPPVWPRRTSRLTHCRHGTTTAMAHTVRPPQQAQLWRRLASMALRRGLQEEVRRMLALRCTSRRGVPVALFIQRLC